MTDKRTKNTFVSNIADASFSHLLELMIALGSYREGLVLVGGWVPYLLLKKYQQKDVAFSHIGSQDIDIAVNPAIVDEKKYATMQELLLERGYAPKEGATFSFIKTVATNRGETHIQIDFLGPEYGGTAKGHRHQIVQDNFHLRKARGSDIVFTHREEIILEGKLPSGGEGRSTIHVANIVGILTMKGIVMGSRYKEKDAYDLTSLILYYKNGPLAVADEVRPFIEHGLVKESLDAIREKFRSRDAEGPTWVADFQEAIGEAREQLKTQAYLQVQRFLLALYELPKPPKRQEHTNNDPMPVLDIEPAVGSEGGSKGHFVHFNIINHGEQVAIDSQWGIRGFAYERKSKDKFVLRPGEKKMVKYQISGEKPFSEIVPELNIFFEYKNNRGVSFFSRRELVQEKVPSGAFYNISKVGQFHPAVRLNDNGIKGIGEPFQNGDKYESVVEIETNNGKKNITIGISRTLAAVWQFTKSEEIKAAIAELAMRKIQRMMEQNNITDYLFTTYDIPETHAGGFEAYKRFRDSL